MANDQKKSAISIETTKSHVSTKSGMQLAFSQRDETSRLRMRRSSYGYGGVPGIKPIEKTSMLGAEYRRPVLIFLNTYQLDPIIPFHVPSVTRAIDELLDELFNDHKYNVQDSPPLAIRIAGELLRTIKAMNFNRYRIISIVTLAQKRAQSYNNAITFLWDHERDNYVNIQRELGADYKRPMLLYLNTYQLDPKVKFHVPSVTKAIEELLDELFTGHKYNVQESPTLALRLAGELLRTVKCMNFNRYRILSIVTLAQKRSQSYNNAITFLWDHERDNYVNVQREVPSCFVQVTVFGIYLD